MAGFLLLHVSQKDGGGRIAILSKSLYRRANDIAKAHTSLRAWALVFSTKQVGVAACKDASEREQNGACSNYAEPMEQRAPSCLHVWLSRDRGRQQST